jgi:hypothetical protein
MLGSSPKTTLNTLMHILNTSPQIITIQDPEILADLVHGLIIIAPEMGFNNGVRAITLTTPFPNGDYCIKCHVFGFKGKDEHGTTWSEVKDLGVFLSDGYLCI